MLSMAANSITTSSRGHKGESIHSQMPDLVKSPTFSITKSVIEMSIFQVQSMSTTSQSVLWEKTIWLFTKPLIERGLKRGPFL